MGTTTLNVPFITARMPSHHHRGRRPALMVTPGIDKAITFVCTRCRSAFRKRVDNTVRSGRAVCRDCSTSPDSNSERRVVQCAEAVMSKLREQGKVVTYSVIRNRKVSVSELASVREKSSSSSSNRRLRWDITVEAKVGVADQGNGLQTQLAHIELDGWQHFRFSALWHKGSRNVYNRNVECDRIKDSIVRKSTTSRYGARFKRVALLRAALVRPLPSQYDGEEHERRLRNRRDTKRAVEEAIEAIEPFLRREFGGGLVDVHAAAVAGGSGDSGNLQLHPPEAYAEAAHL